MVNPLARGACSGLWGNRNSRRVGSWEAGRLSSELLLVEIPVISCISVMCRMVCSITQFRLISHWPFLTEGELKKGQWEISTRQTLIINQLDHSPGLLQTMTDSCAALKLTDHAVVMTSSYFTYNYVNNFNYPFTGQHFFYFFQLGNFVYFTFIF